jgi:hypothetical protein
MKIRRIILISASVASLFVVPALSAFQGTESVASASKAKKVHKAKADAAAKSTSMTETAKKATGRANRTASEATTTVRKSKKALKDKKEAAGRAVTATGTPTKEATGTMSRAASEVTGKADRAASSLNDTVPAPRFTPAKGSFNEQIAGAKARGEVWVNTDTGVYHKGGKWYGATKQGQFMTEQEALKAGYRPAKTK